MNVFAFSTGNWEIVLSFQTNHCEDVDDVIDVLAWELEVFCFIVSNLE